MFFLLFNKSENSRSVIFRTKSPEMHPQYVEATVDCTWSGKCFVNSIASNEQFTKKNCIVVSLTACAVSVALETVGVESPVF